jgi:hypothetical protein
VGAKLEYAKVIDRELFYARGGRIQPGLDNHVVLREEPGQAGAFLVLRGWRDGHGTVTEQWRIEGPGGGVVYESLPREIHLPTSTHVERLEDEVADLEFQYVSDDYRIVFSLDEEEVARMNFRITSEDR